MFIMVRNLPKLFTGFTNYTLKVCDEYAIGLVYGYSTEELPDKLFQEACNQTSHIENPIIYWWKVILFLKRNGIDMSKVRKYRGGIPTTDMKLP